MHSTYIDLCIVLLMENGVLYMHAHTDAHTDAHIGACAHAHTHNTHACTHTIIDPCSAFTYLEWCRPHPAEQIDWGGRGGGGGW